jgi:hypothetical protein
MKTDHIQIRVTKEEKAAIQAASQRAHLEMSQWILQKILPDPEAKLLTLLAKLKRVENTKNRSFILNELASFLARLSGHELQMAIAKPINIGLSELMDNYVAAMIEQACVFKKIAPTLWLTEKTSVEQPFFGTKLQSMRLYLLIVSPPSFKKRNIFIDSSIGELV